MQVRVPVIVKDPVVTEHKDVAPTELITVDADAFLDGPVSPRVAVLDFAPTGGLAEPARFVPPRGRSRIGSYAVEHPVDRNNPDVHPIAAAVSVFGAVHKTIAMFEEQEALGRTVDWAFDAPQLLVVPRAGEMANAFYERESHSLQFFSFRAFTAQKERFIHTAYSQDIVAHETAHALLDGIAPDLYSTISPQSLAIHEAVADLAALLVSLQCRELTEAVLRDTHGDIGDSNAFSGLAEQFAMGLEQDRYYLRNLNDPVRLPDVPHDNPHELSTVLSGAFYVLLKRTYEELRGLYAVKSAPDPTVVVAPEAEFVQQKLVADDGTGPARSGAAAVGSDLKALFVAAERIKRILLRGLDYLPPGDVSFADLARAVLAADEASHPDSDTSRAWLVDELIARGIIRRRRELDVRTNFELPSLAAIDVSELVASDFAAYQFAQRHRRLLRIPARRPFEVRPRLDTTKEYFHRDARRTVREVLFKVSWSGVEENNSGGGLPRQRRYRAGTTLAIGLDREAPYARALISSKRLPADLDATDAMLKRLVETEQLYVSAADDSPPVRTAVEANIAAGVLTVRGLARALHVTAGART
jgi:hypothetical protein